jgi:hypothetical protein
MTLLSPELYLIQRVIHRPRMFKKDSRQLPSPSELFQQWMPMDKHHVKVCSYYIFCIDCVDIARRGFPGRPKRPGARPIRKDLVRIFHMIKFNALDF